MKTHRQIGKDERVEIPDVSSIDSPAKARREWRRPYGSLEDLQKKKTKKEVPESLEEAAIDNMKWQQPGRSLYIAAFIICALCGAAVYQTIL